jgi:hypothetical protein
MSTDVALDGEVGEEGFDLSSAEFSGMAGAVGCLVEANELLGPTDVAVLRAEGVVLDPDLLADLVEELHGRVLAEASGARVIPG